MENLTVFDSRGRALYPEEASDDPGTQQYFDQHIITFGPKGSSYLLEFYFKMHTGERKEQVIIRYEGDRFDSLFDDCRTALQEKLVEQRGWDVQKPHGNSPHRLSWLVIWEGNKATEKDFSPTDLYIDSDHGLGLDRSEAEILEEISNDNRNHVRITAKDYDTIADILPIYLSNNQTVVVSRERQSPPDYADVHFTVSTDQWEEFKLHQNTQKTLDDEKRKRRAQQRQQALNELEATLEKLRNLNTGQADVKQSLSSGLNKTYSNLTVNETSYINDLKRKARTTNQGTSGPTPTPDKQGQKRYDLYLFAGVLSLIVIVFLLYFTIGLPFIGGGSIPLLGWGGGASVAANFNISNVAAPSSITIGESDTINATIQNRGGSQGTQKIEFHWDGSLEESEEVVNLAPNETETVRFEIPNSDTGEYNYTIRTENDTHTSTINIQMEQNESQSTNKVEFRPISGSRRETVQNRLGGH